MVLTVRSFRIHKTLGLQVYKEYLLWALKYIDMTYFGLLGAPMKGCATTGAPTDLRLNGCYRVTDPFVANPIQETRAFPKGPKYPNMEYL